MNRKRSFISDFISRMLPSMIASQLVITICSIIDTALAGHFLGEQAIAAEGMVTPVVLVVAGLSSIMAAGNANICSNESGKCNIDEMNSFFSTTVTVSVGISLIFTTLVLIFSPVVCMMLGLQRDSVLFEQTRGYMCGYVLVMPALSVIMVFPGMLQIEGDNKTSIIAVLTAFLLDIVFDLANLFVFHGGVFGMAMATTLSYWISAAFVLVRMSSGNHTVKYSIKSVRLSRIGEIMHDGLPALIRNLCIALSTAAINAAFLKFGSERYVSIFTVVSQVGELLICFPSGMCELSAMVTGIINGEEDREGLKEILIIMLKKSVIISLALLAVICFSGDLSARIFTLDKNILSLAKHGLRIFTIHILFRCISESYIGYLRGIKRHGLGNMILIFMALCTAVYAYVVPCFLGLESLWYNFVVVMFFNLVFLMVIICTISHKNPFMPDAWILKPDSFGIAKENMMEDTSLSVEDLCVFSSDAAEFVNKHGGSKRQKMLVSLCIEEMGKNIISYAYEKEKDPLLSIKLMFTEEGFKLRFRDNGVHFNPKEYYDLYSGKDDKVSNFGIRMVFGSASDVTFMNTMSYNNLLVRV
ncbi:putative efflux protein, MATE family [Oribacterium sp. KHPX15]|uniref:MATE family efflux transporter n=1 Tax=Oribacterium sp. KHPX15 TaxID=1855342 RepID=UPI00089581F2|nr:MATE family efflux transporter [Oribacterium sp. KHPX15]SDZ98597.1 putative efflux protein, MATE family [Oribacterium sp. KHPX15]